MRDLTAIDLFKPPPELATHVQHVSTYETSLDVVVELSLKLPGTVFEALGDGSRFAEGDRKSVV